MDLTVLDLPVDVQALDPGVVLASIAVLVVLLLLAILALGRRRARQGVLEERFGSEYLRIVESERSRRKAEEQLAARMEHRDAYETRTLDATERDSFRARWDDVQLSFVDGPASAARAAADLTVEVAVTRGYPDEDPERCLDDLSVDHPELVADLRRAEGNLTTTSTTEHHRELLVRARSLFERLVSDGEPRVIPAAPPQLAEPAATLVTDLGDRPPAAVGGPASARSSAAAVVPGPTRAGEPG